MRSVRRITLGVAILACALAVMAVPALAAPPEFESTGGPIKGAAEGEQIFKLGVFEITCEKAKITGLDASTPAASKVLGLSIKYGKCTTRASIHGNPIKLPTKFVTPFDIEYNADGLVQKLGSETEEPFEGSGELIVTGGEIEIKVKPIKCLVTIEPQSVPFKPGKKTEFETTEFENETIEHGNKEYNGVLITNEWKGVHFEYGEGQCEEFKKSEEELHSGKYEGELLVGIKAGNLYFT